MKRVLATELTLVNWKGVFYERYLLDSNVTALEGDNGSGKTTVMIAAYLVLLPDLSRLRFTNLGETGATGGDRGIWGRLGQLARPSYAALTLRLGDGTELIAGVVIVRKAEPTLELQPFLIERLPREARARDFLLRVTEEHDEIPTVEEVEQAVLEAGATLERFLTSKAYFARLFEMGVNPMRLSSDEERNKYNDMLRTSMTGGISRALTSELRSFVFKQETGLSDTLGRMRTNLAACRQTRTEVVESRQLERHISGIYDAGLGMFEGALLASAAEALENTAELSLAKRAEEDAETEWALQQTLLAEVAARRESLDPQLETVRAEGQRAKERVERYRRALLAAERVAELRREFETAERELRTAREQQERTTLLRADARQRWGELQSAVSRSAQGLANLQTGLEELHQRAHAHRRIVEQLSLAQSALLRSGFDATRLQGLDPEENEGERRRELLSELQREATSALLATDEERATRARLAESARVHGEEYQRAREALLEIAGEADLPLRSFALIDCAREHLSRLARLDALAPLAGRLQGELQTFERRAERWRTVRERARELGLPKDIDARALAENIASLDAEVRSQREAAREASWQAREFEANVEQCAALRAEAEEQSLRYRALAEAAKGLFEAGIAVEPRSADWDALSDELEGRAAAVERRVAKLTAERGDALLQAARFDAAEETPSEELSRIRDLVSGEFLTRRFEELEPDTARVTEARLGPLRDAIVVEDLAEAEQVLAKESRTVTDVWLVSAASDVSAYARPELHVGKDVTVPTPSGMRVSRVPEQASLGRVARQRRAESLRKLAASRSKALEEEERGLRQLRNLSRDLQRLRDERRLFSAGDPSERLTELEARSESARRAADERHAFSREASELAMSASLRVEALRPLLADAALFDDASVERRVSELGAKLLEADTAQRELERVSEARQRLQRLLDVLRTEPPSREVLAAWPAAQRALDEKRDALFAAVEALEASAKQLHALDFAEASAALARQTATVPELEQQHQALAVAASEAEAAYAELEARWNTDTESFQEHKARGAAIAAHIERALGELLEAGYDAPEPAGLEGLVREAEDAERLVATLEEEGRSLLARSALAKERSETSRARRDAARASVQAIGARAAPAQRAWQTLQARARELRLVLPTRGGETTDNSQRHWARARSLRQLLSDRLEATGEATELLERLPSATGDDATAILEAWLEVRAWLHKRLPAQVADVADPLEALMRLRDDLTTLEGRLRHQETELRGASEDVARSIEAQVRRSTRQVRRINQYLEGIRFGSVHAIRIRVGRVEKMAQVLEALRDGSAQKLLFQSHLPFEAALEEIFLRYGGGRGGGHRILDYREYIDLQVEVQRRVADSPWEPANPTRVSTGEAIGVGAALMMVILTEWERDANLMRGSRPFGSLRFLFLDEANRLSQDNLGVLFELCQSLQLQLLIAAPEVARSSGNTTYRLVRRLTEDGNEEVLVTGRRSGLPEEESQSQEA